MLEGEGVFLWGGGMDGGKMPFLVVFFASAFHLCSLHYGFIGLSSMLHRLGLHGSFHAAVSFLSFSLCVLAVVVLLLFSSSASLFHRLMFIGHVDRL